MSDCQPPPPASLIRINAGRQSGYRALPIAALAMLGLCWMALATSSHMSYTCAVCRMDRVDRNCFGVNWSEQQETDCSRWYAKNVEPVHAHVWAMGTHCQPFGIPGIYRGHSCWIGAPVTMLAWSVQIEIYQHFESPLEAKPLFLDLGRRDASSGPTFTSLMDWVDAGYPGTWTAWQETHRPTSP